MSSTCSLNLDELYFICFNRNPIFFQGISRSKNYFVVKDLIKTLHPSNQQQNSQIEVDLIKFNSQLRISQYY